MRGANGIILITTKRGTEMTAPQIRVKAEFGITQPVQLPELANASQWIDYYNELYRDSGSTEMPISDYARQMYLSGRDPDLYPNVDWVNTIFKDLAMTGRVHASVTGGSPKIRYYVSASYYTEGGMFNVADNDRYNAQMNFNKYSFRSNIDIDITKSTQLGLSLSTQYTTKNAPCTTTNDLYAYTMYVTPVATPTVFSNGMLAIPQESGSVNPYNMLNNTGYRRYNTMVAQSLLSLTQDFSDIITPGLKANVKFAWDAQNATLLERAMSPVTYYATGRDENGELMLTAANPNGSNYMRLATSDSSGTTAINFEGSLIYERLFAEDHRVSGHVPLLGTQQIQEQARQLHRRLPDKEHGYRRAFHLRLPRQVFRRVQLRLQRFRELRPRQALRLLPLVRRRIHDQQRKILGAAARQGQHPENPRLVR